MFMCKALQYRTPLKIFGASPSSFTIQDQLLAFSALANDKMLAISQHAGLPHCSLHSISELRMATLVEGLPL